MTSLLGQPASKWVVAILMATTLVFALILLQQQFDSGDMRRALELLNANAGEELRARAKGQPVNCQPKLLSSFAGTVELTCTTGETGPYVFTVDLVRKQVQPTNESARELLDEAG